MKGPGKKGQCIYYMDRNAANGMFWMEPKKLPQTLQSVIHIQTHIRQTAFKPFLSLCEGMFY